METIEIEYRGFVISHPKVPMMGGQFTVNVASNDANLLPLLPYNDRVIVDHASIEGAINEAKRLIDRALGA